METADVQVKVKQVIASVLKIKDSEIADEANFIFDLGADSLQSIELIAGFEEEFDVELEEDKALEIQTVSDAVSFIESYL